MAEDQKRPLLTAEEIEFRRTFFILELDLQKLLTERDQYIWEDREAIQNSEKALPFGEPDFSKLQDKFLELRGMIKGLLFENYSAQAEAIFLVLHCEREQFITQRTLMELRNEHDYKHIKKVYYDSSSFADIKVEIDRLQREADEI